MKTIDNLQAEPSSSKHLYAYKVGYHQFHPDIQINYQLNRCLAGGREEDINKIAPRIKDFNDWKREMLQIAKQALDDHRLNNAAYYYRYSCFFAGLDDPDRINTYETFKKIMCTIYQDAGLKRYEVPYNQGYLPALRKTPSKNRGTIIITSGFDSYLEEYIPRILYFASAGFDVIAFNGPGQGEALDKCRLYMTHEWEKPLGTILDYFALNDVTAIGISLGGNLVMRAAAFDSRIKQVIAFDVLYDFYDCVQSKNSSVTNIILKATFKLKMDFIINSIIQRKMKRDILTNWSILQGMIVMGQNSPAKFLSESRKYSLKGCMHLIKQDVLILAGSEDHYVPLTQFHEQIKSLINARSITGRIFTRSEQAHNHCQYGNIESAQSFILNWIDQVSKEH